MMTLTEAEIEIYKRVGQFADRSKYLIGSTLLFIGDDNKNLGTELNTELENITVRIENQPLENGQPFITPKNKPWCKVSLQYADSQIASIGDGPCIRDQGIIKQDLDYSCGAASIATLLNGYFQQNITEEQVLKIMDKGDLMASFDDM